MIPNEEHIEESRLSAYLDSELAPLEMRQVATHVAACKNCNERLSELLTGQAAVRSLPPSEMEVPPWGALKMRIDRGPTSRPSSTRKRFIPVAASVMLLSLLWVVYFSPTDLPESNNPNLNNVETIALDLGLYLQDLDHPSTESRFEKAYQVIPAAYESALRFVGIEEKSPLELVPSQFEVLEVSIVEYRDSSPAARIVYLGPSGRIVIFCQRQDAITSFSGFVADKVKVRDTSCTSVYCSQYRALSFETQAGAFTVVGSRIGSALDDLVNIILP